MTPDWLIAAGAVATALLALAGLWRLTRPVRAWARAAAAKTSRALDVVLGTEPVTDPDTGAVVIPARPDIGVRTARMEGMLEEVLTGAVEEAKQSAREAAASAAAALAVAEQVTEVSRKVDELTIQVTGWQTGDRVRAETATAVLHEVGMTLPLPAPGESIDGGA